MGTPKINETENGKKQRADPVEICALIQKRKACLLEQRLEEADAIDAKLEAHGVALKSQHDIDATQWYYIRAADYTEARLGAARNRTGPTHRERQSKLRQARSVGKKVRFQHFCDFCVETFGMDRLKEGGGVLDVAGGKARMALELCLERHIPCTVVDPSFSKLSDFTAKRIATLALASTSASETVTGSAAVVVVDPNNNNRHQTLASASHHHHLLSPSAFFSKSDQDDPDRRQKIDAFMAQIGFQFHKCLFNEEYCRGNPTWEDSSVVIGMHPDEATEHIVDEALKVGKPFAVVPCCVFPSLFRERRLFNGKTVRSLEQFIQYLLEKDTGILVQVLENVPGCNTVVYKV
jgi:hypothetical protein